MPRLTAVAIAGLMVSTALTTAPAHADTMTLDFPTYQLQQGFGPWWRALVEAYEAENPDVRINLTNSPSNDHHANLATRFIGGNPPDIVHMTARFLWGHVENGFIDPLGGCIADTDILDSWIPDQERLVIDGEHYGLLLLTYSFGLFYNKDMFAEAGLAVPETLEAFMAAAGALTVDRDGDGRIDQYGVAINTVSNSWGFVEFMHFHAGRDRDIVMDGELDSVEEITATLEIIDRLVSSGASLPGLDNNPKRQLFWSGDAAMYIDGSWATAFADSQASEAMIDAWAVAPLPFDNMAGGPSNVLAIPANISPERKAAVCDFIRFAASPQWQAAYATITGNPAGRRDSVTEEAREVWPDLPMFETAAAARNRSHMPIGFEADFNEFAAIVMDGVTGMLSTDRSPRETAEEIHTNLTTRFFGD